MSESSPRPDYSVRTALVGVARLARGRADGLNAFGHTKGAFLSSLTPLLAFPLIGSLTSLFSGRLVRAVLELLAAVAALLTPPVVTHGLARLWGREAWWLRFATAFNWCQLGLLIVAFGGLMVGFSVGGQGSGVSIVAALALYGLWLHWFLARHGLGISSGRAVLLVLCVHAATTVVVLGPRVLAALWRAAA